MPEEKGKFFFYFVIWVLSAVAYEQISRYFGYVIYKGWKVWYSVLFYMSACLCAGITGLSGMAFLKLVVK
ncbi:hypothetical protein GCM10009865_02770 [Aeromicrobium ponti]